MIRGNRLGPLLLLALVIGCAGSAPARHALPSSQAPPPDRLLDVDRDARAWIDRTLDALPLRRKIAQMIMPWMAGSFLTEGSPEHQELARLVRDEGVGGLIVSIGAPGDMAARIASVQRLADVPLLVAADLEHGPGQRLRAGLVFPWGMDLGGGTAFPPAMALAATGDERLAYELGRVTALEARPVGISLVFAPVADVNNNPDNPIINVRSYGADPAAVARFAVAHLRGLQEHGLLATAKHFPGHGDVGQDSHLVPLSLHVDRARADSVELVPFTAAIDAGVAAVMSAHIAVPALTGDSLRPATLSPRALRGLLRGELGHDGLIVTDAMNMGAIVRAYGAGESAVLAVEAGADIVLQPSMPDALDALVAAVESGRLEERRIDESVRRILRAKARLGLHRVAAVAPELMRTRVAAPSHRALAQEAAERSLTLVRDRGMLVPVRPLGVQRPLSIVYTDDPDPVAGRVLHRELASRLPGLSTLVLGPDADAADLEEARTAAEQADRVLVSLFVRAVANKGTVALPEPVAALVRALDAARPTVVTSFGNPYLLAQFPDVGTYLLAWGQGDTVERAVARALAGEAAITGRLPIPLPPDYAIGHGMDRAPGLTEAMPAEVGVDVSTLLRVDAVIERAIRRGVTPGAALAVARHGRLVRLRGYGRTDRRRGWPDVTDSTMYDLASLTKALGTATAVMLLVEDGRLDLDAPVRRYLPDWHVNGEAGKAGVTVRHLLLHSSGLPTHQPFWRQLSGRDAMIARIGASGLDYPPGAEIRYSDLGMIALGAVVEEVAGRPLDAFLAQGVFAPLGLRETMYRPLDEATEPEVLLARVAPTELDTVFRGRHVHGEVHDENAFAMGGVAGHAGLFSSARDVAVLAQMLLNGGTYGGVRLLRPETVRDFTRARPEAEGRALGWATPAHDRSAGDRLSPLSFGHTGFTGTSVWIDPQRDLVIVLLTNRINPSRASSGIQELRRTVHDLAVDAVTEDVAPAAGARRSGAPR